MGKDIKMFIVHKGRVIAEDFYKGRNQEWFNNIGDNGWNDLYDELYRNYGISDQAPADLKEKYTQEKGYYDFFHIKVQDFIDWFTDYRPFKDATWMTTYDKWQYDNRGIIPEIKHFLNKDDILADMHFVEVIDPDEQSIVIYNYLIDKNIPKDADITYFFY